MRVHLKDNEAKIVEVLRNTETRTTIILGNMVCMKRWQDSHIGVRGNVGRKECECSAYIL